MFYADRCPSTITPKDFPKGRGLQAVSKTPLVCVGGEGVLGCAQFLECQGVQMLDILH